MKFPVLDYIRAIAVILVTYYHVITYGPHASSFLGPIADFFDVLSFNEIVSLVLGNVLNLGEIGVSLFFLVSGFLIMKSRVGKTVGSFIIRRLIRIYPIAIAGVIFSFLFIVLINHYYCETPLTVNLEDLVAILTNSLLINGLIPTKMDSPIFGSSTIMPTYWFLAVIVKYYLVMCFVSTLNKERILTIALLLMLVSSSYYLFRTSNFYNFSPICSRIISDIAFSSHHIIFILIGSSIYINYRTRLGNSDNEKIQSIKTSFSDCIYPILIVFAFITSFYTLKKIPDFPLPADMLKNYFLSLLIFVVCVVCNRHVTKVCGVVRLVSNTSFCVYVLHYAFGACILVVLLNIDFLRNYLFLIYLITFTLIGLCGYFLYKFIEQPAGSIKVK